MSWHVGKSQTQYSNWFRSSYVIFYLNKPKWMVQAMIVSGSHVATYVNIVKYNYKAHGKGDEGYGFPLHHLTEAS